MIEIQYGEPRINKSNIHMLVITFPFIIIKHSSNAEYGKKIKKEISVSINDVLLSIWAYSNESEIEKVLFQFSLDKIKSISFEELMKEDLNIYLDLGNKEPNKRFDPSKIQNPLGFTFQIDDDIAEPKNKIGF